jgi:hypothetical protein
MLPDSNLTVSRRQQLPKQALPRRATVDGMQIELSKSQWAKALRQMRHNCESGSNVTEEMNLRPAKQKLESSRISDRIKISEADPKYRKIESLSTFNRKSPSVKKTVLPGSTVIILISVSNSAEIDNVCSDAGIEK